jgi:HK97 family phage prohead protease
VSTVTIEQAAEVRALRTRQRGDRPSQRRSAPDAGARAAVRCTMQLRSAESVEWQGMQAVRIGGYASVYGDPYQMWDWAGPYMESVAHGAGAQSLADAPLTEYVTNHGKGGGLPLAHTRNSTLVLAEDETGLSWDAYVDPRRSDATDLILALERGDVAEASFRFMIEAGEWSPDYSAYTITRYNIDHGDVSTVNFGANSAASSTLRDAPQVLEQRAVEVPPQQRALALRLQLALAGD